MTLMLTIIGIVALVIIYMVVRYRQARAEIERLLATNHQLESKNQQLTQQKATAESQVKNAQLRSRNEQEVRAVNRNQLIDSLQHTHDLRD